MQEIFQETENSFKEIPTNSSDAPSWTHAMMENKKLCSKVSSYMKHLRESLSEKQKTRNIIEL